MPKLTLTGGGGVYRVLIDGKDITDTAVSLDLTIDGPGCNARAVVGLMCTEVDVDVDDVTVSTQVIR